MTKSELNTGMHVRLKNGKMYLAIKDCYTLHHNHQNICFIRDGDFLVGEHYSEDLKNIIIDNDEFNIDVVYDPGVMLSCKTPINRSTYNLNESGNRHEIWRRKE